MEYIRPGALKVGTVVRFKVGGEYAEFLVVHQGNPSEELYDSSCNGTWLLAKDIYSAQAWNSSAVNTYETSAINSYLNNTYYNAIDASIRGHIRQVKIPYRQGGGSGGTNKYGGDGLSVKIFLLGGWEVGLTNSLSGVNYDGHKLDYFEEGYTQTVTANLRKAKSGGAFASWWLRSPRTPAVFTDTQNALYINERGFCDKSLATASKGVRPAFIIENSLWVDENGELLLYLPPPPPGNVTVGPCREGKMVDVTWDRVTSPNNGKIWYFVYISTNGEPFRLWIKTAARSTSYTFNTAWNTMQLKIFAQDEGTGLTSEPVFTRAYAPKRRDKIEVIPGIRDLGVKTEGFVFDYAIASFGKEKPRVTEYINTREVRTFTPELWKTYSIDVTGNTFAALYVSTYSLRVEVIDSFGSAFNVIKFKKVRDHFSVELKKPLYSSKPVKRLTVDVKRSMAEGSEFKVEATNDPYDRYPVWEDCTFEAVRGLAYVFKNKINMALRYGVNIRVSGKRGTAAQDSWITGISGNYD